MSRVDTAELRRLWEAANKPEGWTAIEHGNFTRAAFNALPALLDQLEASREEVRRLKQANGDIRKERDRAVAEAKRQDGVAKGLRKERNALAADNARLRAALEEIGGPLIVPDADGLIDDATCTYCETSSIEGCDEDCPREIAEEALAATPAQSLAAHDAALLREVAGGVDKIAVVPTIDTPQSMRDLIADAIRAKADRIEKEAANG